MTAAHVRTRAEDKGYCTALTRYNVCNGTVSIIIARVGLLPFHSVARLKMGGASDTSSCMCELAHTRCLVRATERDTRTDANVLSRDRWHVEVPKQHKCPSRRHITSESRDSLNQHTLSAVTVSLSFLRVRRLLVFAKYDA